MTVVVFGVFVRCVNHCLSSIALCDQGLWRQTSLDPDVQQGWSLFAFCLLSKHDRFVEFCHEVSLLTVCLRKELPLFSTF